MNFLLSLGSRIRAVHPHHHAIFRGMATVTLFIFVSKLVGAAKEMAVAWRYGIGAEIDAYQFVYNLIAWPLGIWASVLTAVLVPLAGRIRQTGYAESKSELQRFRPELLGLALLLGSALGVLAWFGIGAMLRFGWTGLPQATARLAADALPGLVLLLPLGVLVALQSAWMLSAGRHLNTLLECVPPLVIGAAVLIAGGGAIDALVWGTVLGSLFHLLALSVPMARNSELEAPAFTRRSQQWGNFWQGFGIMLVGQALMSLTVIVDQFFAVDLDTGAIATLSYANRLLSLILSLAAIAVSRATLPVFSQAPLNGVEHMHTVAVHWSRMMLLAGIAAMAIGYWLAPWCVRVLFERGAFTAADTRTVAEVLRYSLPQLPFYFSSMVLVSFALSQRRFVLVFCSGVIGFAAKLLGNMLLFGPLGIDGIALAAALMYGANALFFLLTVGRGAR